MTAAHGVGPLPETVFCTALDKATYPAASPFRQAAAASTAADFVSLRDLMIGTSSFPVGTTGEFDVSDGIFTYACAIYLRAPGE